MQEKQSPPQAVPTDLPGTCSTLRGFKAQSSLPVTGQAAPAHHSGSPAWPIGPGLQLPPGLKAACTQAGSAALVLSGWEGAAVAERGTSRDRVALGRRHLAALAQAAWAAWGWKLKEKAKVVKVWEEQSQQLKSKQLLLCKPLALLEQVVLQGPVAGSGLHRSAHSRTQKK